MDGHTTRAEDMFQCRVGIVDALGNALLYDHTIPYNVDFKGFLEYLQVGTFHSLLKIHDESDYTNWIKRLDFLSSDQAGIAKLALLIEQHQHTDYEELAEWLWIHGDLDGIGGSLITGEKEFSAFMALAQSGKLGKGCLMRVSESKVHEITATLKHLEVEEDRKGLVKCEEAFRDREWRQRNQVQVDDANPKKELDSAVYETRP